jgi:hypothetical protein
LNLKTSESTGEEPAEPALPDLVWNSVNWNIERRMACFIAFICDVVCDRAKAAKGFWFAST